MSEWTPISLKDATISANTGLDAIKRAPIVEHETGIKCLRIQDITQNKPFSNWGNTHVSNSNFEKFQLKAGEIIMARTCSTGANLYVKEDISAVFNNGLVRIRVDRQKLIPKYAYYLFMTKDFVGHIDGISGGTSVQLNMQVGDLLSYQFILPPLGEQQAIAEVLSSLDDKIDLLQRQNKTLEQMAETLFRQWYIEESKDSWSIGILQDLCLTISSGGTPSTKEDSYYNGDVNWYSTKELNDNFLFESISKITALGLENSSAKLFPIDTIIIAIYAAPTVGRLGILAQEGSFNQAACGLICDRKKCSKEFIYLFLKNQREELNQLATGSAQQNLNVGKIKNYPVAIPPPTFFQNLEKATQPLFDKIKYNSIQIRTLEAKRGILLPKLMNGAVRVSPVNSN